MDKKKKLIIQIIIFVLLIIILTIVYNYVTNQMLNNKEEENKMDVLEIMSTNFEQEVLKSEQTVIVDFFATWCGPCKMMSPVMQSIANEKTDVKVVKVDIDKNQDLATQYNVMSIPTIIIFKNGEVTKTFIGVTDKTDIIEAL